MLPPTGHNSCAAKASPPHNSPGLTEDGNSIVTQDSSPQTPSKLGANQPTTNPPSSTNATGEAAIKATPNPKRKRMTEAEKEAQEKEQAEKKKEREEKAAARAADKARQEEEKAERAKDREEKAAARAAEKARQEEEKAERAKEREEKREEKRKQKEEEDKAKAQKAQEKEDKKRQAQEAKEKEARKQPKLKSFFGAPSTPKKVAVEEASTRESPQKGSPAAVLSAPPASEYQKLFKPFFVKDNTSMATPATQMDDETREAKSVILDQFISGERAHELPSEFDATAVLALPMRPSRRGKPHHAVKHIMEEAFRETCMPGADDANKSIQQARARLARIPMKVIAFSQDVRPPYYGTMTLRPYTLGGDHMRKLARRSMGRRLPLEYEYDSEAEWQEDDGEDIDVDDDESDLDDEDDMEGDGFLDDSEDLGPARRAISNTIEPESSGMCFENHARKGPNPALNQYRMEIILDGRLPSSMSDAQAASEEKSRPEQVKRVAVIDPWSTAYWEPEPKPAPKPMGDKASTKMAPPAAPCNAFSALSSGASAASNAPVKVVKNELMNDVKKAILDNKGLSKAGIVDFVFQQFRDSASRTEVKNTIEMVAEKQGSGKVKEWSLRPGHEITA